MPLKTCCDAGLDEQSLVTVQEDRCLQSSGIEGSSVY